MTEHEIDSHFQKAGHLLWWAWDARKLYRLADEQGKAFEFLDEDMYPPSSRELREHLRQCSAKAIAGMDALLEAVPYCEHSQLRAMELLVGTPTAWGATVDVTSRAEVFTKGLQHLVQLDNDDASTLISEAEYYRGSKAADAMRDRIRRENHYRWLAVQSDLHFEVLRVFQHFHSALKDWSKAPSKPTTFKDLFGEADFERIRSAMDDAGIRPKAAKGKNDVVAAFHAACVRLGKPLPRPSHWPLMLADLFPETNWNEKSKPEERPSYRSKAYTTAYAAIMDRLG